MMLTRPRRTREVTGSQPHSVGIIAKPTKRLPADQIIREARMTEERFEEANFLAKQNKLVDIKSDWETKTNKKILMNNVRSRMNTIKANKTANLEARRDRLRQLLSDEEEFFMNEMESKEETQLERQAKMREKAKQLRERREEERRAVAREKLELQFRLQCEELRGTQSKRQMDLLAAERQLQMQEKEERALEEKRMNNIFDDLWKADYEAKLKREEEDERKRLSANFGMTDILLEQMEVLKEKKLAEKAVKEEEARLLEEDRKLRKIEEERAHRDKLEKQRKTRNMLDKSIRLKEARKAELLQEELAFDMKQLEELLEASKNELKQQIDNRQQLRREDEIYRRYLNELREAQRLEEIEMDKICDRQIQAAYDKQTQQRRLEREARKKLLDEIIVGRRQQIEDRLRQIQIAKQEALIEKEKVARMIQENNVKDKEEKMKIKQKAVRYQTDLIGQIDYNFRQRQIMADEEERLYKTQSAVEQEYRSKIETALKDVQDPHLHPMRKALSSKSHQFVF